MLLSNRPRDASNSKQKIASKKQMRAQIEQKEKGFLQNRDRVG